MTSHKQGPSDAEMWVLLVLGMIVVGLSLLIPWPA
jgi:hypothetical protein